MLLKLRPSYCLVFRGSELIMPPEAEERRVLDGIPADLARRAFPPEEIEYIDAPLTDGGASIPCFSVKNTAVLPSGWRGIPVRALAAGGVPGVDAGPGAYCGAAPSAMALVFRLCHIMQWISESAFCGRCGGKNIVSGIERRCPACGRVEYPRVSPAVIVRITNDSGGILLAHDKKFSENIYSLIAGFCEAGERLEDTVEREILEEVGLSVTNIRYLASQSWPFPNSLMIGFAADFSGGEIRCDGVEIEDARWFSRGSLPQLPGRGSIARFIIEQWNAGQD